MQKPVGVTILAILYFIGTGLLTLLGIASIVGMGFLQQMAAKNPDVGSSGAALLAGAGIFVAILFFCFALVCAFLGYGMWNLKNWARTLAIVFSVIGVVFSGLALVWAVLHFSPFGVVTSGIRLGINGLIIWYLNQPHVKAAFAIGSLPAAGVPGPAGTIR